uniref:RRM domain-containing protein n=1 Tax=Brassica oleracea TaxID=3712 RepID=A0A3P6G1H5_BRAOL|nr:unnamed protein product [Brassica oleracea]
MDEYGSVRSTYKGFESEAAMKETLDKYGSKPRAIISVEGYDTCLPEEDIKSELTNHFNSCGEVFNVIVRKDLQSPNLDRRALVILLGDGAEEKALELNGTDIGGWNALVKKITDSRTISDNTKPENPVLFTIAIGLMGYDTCLPEEDIKSELTNHFNSCGEVFNVIVRKDLQSPNLDRRALVILLGDGAEEKALELNGTDIGGWNALVKVEPEEVEDEEAELYESSNYIMTADFGLALPLGDITLSSLQMKSRAL